MGNKRDMTVVYARLEDSGRTAGKPAAEFNESGRAVEQIRRRWLGRHEP